jgi:tellurite methyltransferase
MGEPSNPSVNFFDSQFRRQVAAGDYTLNPFEEAILPYLLGDVLDLGCGLGNLAMAAAARGCRVTALDASPTAVADLAQRAQQQNLPIAARQADLRRYLTDTRYDCVVSVGLLMFFAKDDAQASLAAIREMVKPGGIAAVNVLIEGTTFIDMFDPQAHYLFGEAELPAAFPGWKIEYSRIEVFPAPRETIKRFCTLVARRPK